MTIVSMNRARPPVDHRCQVIRVTPLSESTFEVELRATDRVLRYQAGHYLQLEIDVHVDGQRHSLSYSIANSFDPSAPERLQLFVQTDSTFARLVLARLRKLSAKAIDLTVRLPMGGLFYRLILSYRTFLSQLALVFQRLNAWGRKFSGKRPIQRSASIGPIGTQTSFTCLSSFRTGLVGTLILSLLLLLNLSIQVGAVGRAISMRSSGRIALTSVTPELIFAVHRGWFTALSTGFRH